MADSGDDEYDRKRRDKFRGERAADAAAYSNRGSERAVRAREDWPERDAWSRPRPRDYPGRVRDRGYSPSIEPAMKRPRTDYYGGGDYFAGSGGFAAASAYHPAAHRREIAANQVVGAAGDSGSGQPPMLSFKAFLATQDDNISDSEAIEKYNDYKLEFQRQQLNEFFVGHKDDEWFRIKYHPEDSAKRKEEQTNFIKKRVDIFVGLLKEGRLNASLDCVHTNALVKLLDTVVIKLEDGNEEDIDALEKEYEEKEEPKPKDVECKKNAIEEKSDENKDNEKEDGEDGELEEDKKEDVKSDEDDKDKKDDVNGEAVDIKDNTRVDDAEDVKGKDNHEAKADRNNSDSDDGMEKQDEPEKEKIESEEKMDVDQKEKEENIEDLKDTQLKVVEEQEVTSPKEVEVKNNEITKAPKDKKRKRSRSYSGSSSSSSTSGSGSSSDSDSDNEKVQEKDKDNDQSKYDGAKEKTNGKKDGAVEAEKELNSVENNESNRDKATGENEDDKGTIVKIKNEDDNEKKEDKRSAPLHKTTSIFLRSLAPSITRQEVEAMCSKYAGFLRVALADPQPERRWQRRGWVTYRRDANIKEICWALNNARLRDCDLGAIMNRDLSRRIRPVSGIAAHRSVVRTDIRVAARVAVHMDGKYGLWKNAGGEQDEFIATIEKEDKFTPFGFLSHNPVLHNITDYLIEEASAEEDLLLGLEPTGGDDIGSVDGTNVQIERDDALVSVLDRIILYLRVVHSIDYYNHCEYPNEDEMPSRCGILHARGPTPSARADITHLLGAQAENRMANFLPEVASVNDVLAQGGGSKSQDNKKTDNEQKLVALAMKDVDGEIDKFVQANTRELAKDKWLCPLSGKKFKGPDFVRKHIFNKHAEKIEEVKKEVEFFNNYLKDAKRPASADQHQHQQQQQQQQQAKREEMPNNNNLGYLGGGHQPQQSYGGYGGGYMGGRYGGGYGGYSRPHRGGYSHRGRGGASGGAAADGYRPIIHYRDLDAPREPEEFI